jgi:aspartokinase/homoserine dehydrogenase 1
MKVLKFGGSSLNDENCISKVKDIIISYSKKEKIAVVLSAMKGITDSLIYCARESEKGNKEYKNELNNVIKRHLDVIRLLFKEEDHDNIIEQFNNIFSDLKDILHGVQLIHECTLRSMDLIMSFGERLSCKLVNLLLKSIGLNSEFVDAREIIVTDNNYSSAQVFYKETYDKIKNRISGKRDIYIITGFIASTKDDVTTTLGRNGSDYTASIIGAGINAECVEIWTDVDGAMSADPRSVKNAFVIDGLSYQEAMELSYFGAEVIHPYTMIPAVELNIPIIIKNTFNPEAKGTIISKESSNHNTAITGIASIDNIALVNAEGGGMIGIPGISSRILGALAHSKVNVIMISQASSEHSICIIFKQNQCDTAIKGLNKELEKELKSKRISEFEILKDLAVIAIIGENMRGTPGISGRLFSCLGKNSINVLAIAQGSSEMNLSFVISNKDKDAALNVIHNAFLEEK